jgi:DNA-damage-inducible protein J
MSKIEVRTDDSLKRDVQQILAGLGLDLSTAVNMFLVQVRLRKGIPFPIVTENGFTVAEERAILREVEEAERSGKKFTSVEALHRDILGA